MNTDKPLAVHWGTDGKEIVSTPERMKELYRGADTNLVVWGADERDPTLDVGGGTERVKFHPGRDYRFAGAASMASMEWDRLKDRGLPLKSNLFKGEDADVANDLSIFMEVCDGDRKRQGWSASALFDAAPNLYIAQETIKQTGEIIEEDLIDMSARTLLPNVNMNTWLDAYRYDRIAEKLMTIAMPVSLSTYSERGTPQSGDVERAPVYKSLEFFNSGASWQFFELERHAEARANGAPNIDIVQRRLKLARFAQEVTYNFTALFGFPLTGRKGLFNELVTANRNVAAAQQLGANGNPEEDLALFVDNWTEMLTTSVMAEKPDAIALGTGAMIYISTTDYKTVDAGMNESLIDAIFRKLRPLGLRDIVWAPEMDYRSAQATSWQNDTKLPAALAAAWAGGLNGENVMLMYKKDPEVGRMVTGKEIAAQPQDTVKGRTEVELWQSLGDYDLRRPISFRLVTDIGPA